LSFESYEKDVKNTLIKDPRTISSIAAHHENVHHGLDKAMAIFALGISRRPADVL